MRLNEKVAVITGGGSGIGRATSIRFAAEGSVVVVSDIHRHSGEETVDLIKEAGGRARFIQADVSSEQDMNELISETEKRYERIDILFNNAGVPNEEVKLPDLSLEEWDRVMNINLKGVFLGMKFALPIMEKQGSGSIINTSSYLGVKGRKYMAAYNASKGGVITLTKNAALEYGPKQIRVNAIAPGVIDTAIVDKWKENEAKWEIITRANALKRLGKPEEVANAVVFLASDEASYITGTTLMIDGGALTL
ncbi:short-chain dehydrogenase [Salipaludibacillus keqinensis]|uniref:Short-chain dehydrogenase n=1 Tax=Salipaludibacillus keqinensis TaxID=2045207 RepID=A0A323TB61_9BACI|nr:glucose 1-dehydrogenase [Salipaludibacillus keqinensis]PYZ92180.1 short-chain dehydrogenase [Salipaludibacillus keqinensis]